jgi:flagellar biosynthesis/type III secretory pathway chaperone
MDQKLNGHISEENREELGFLYERLLANLDRELSVQQLLLQILEDEREALTISSTGAVEETNIRKEELLLRGKENAASRRSIIDRICSFPGWQGKEVNLSELVNMAADETTASQLQDRQHKLTNLINTICVTNHRNEELIQAALKDVQGSLQLIRGMISPGANYQKTGQFSTNTVQGALIHREG